MTDYLLMGAVSEPVGGILRRTLQLRYVPGDLMSSVTVAGMVRLVQQQGGSA